MWTSLGPWVTADNGANQSIWEVGGSCNFAIAAARLGLRAECAGRA
jgi:sugar/nucleoside kinase (ribokinase family)